MHVVQVDLSIELCRMRLLAMDGGHVYALYISNAVSPMARGKNEPSGIVRIRGFQLEETQCEKLV